jgi:hypothetical protein
MPQGNLVCSEYRPAEISLQCCYYANGADGIPAEALGVDMEEGVVGPLLHDLRGNTVYCVRAEIAHWSPVGLELESLDLSLIPLSVAVVRNAPDLAFRMDVFSDTVLFEDRFEQQRVKSAQ